MSECRNECAKNVTTIVPCLVAELDNVLVGELNEWVSNPLGPGQTSALEIKT